MRLRALRNGRVTAARRLSDGVRLLARSRVAVEPLDDNSWLVRRGRARRRRVERIGPERLRTHLVVDDQAVRSAPHKLQRGLADIACHEQTAWLLRELEVDCLLDVGANTGQFAHAMRRAGYQGRMVSFEPMEQPLERLRSAAARDPEWEVRGHALGDRDGTAEIHGRPGAMSSLLDTSEFGRSWHPRLRESAPETIEVRRLDGLYDELTADLEAGRVFLKMDTQGFDLQVFAGAGARVHDLVGLQSELSYLPIYDGTPTMREALDVYERAGFALAGLFPVSYDRRTARVVEFDAVMVRGQR